ncbi:MAG: hypothetical protein HKM99_04815 [Flavobacteriaceae bacterium]|nr:hypothetical protein [Flavobacteriaceae bacterium]
MKPVTIEFKVKSDNQSFKEDCVTFDDIDALFEFVAPGGDCEKMPSDLNEIQMTFLSSHHPVIPPPNNTRNPIADKRATLQIGMVFFTGALSTLVQFSEVLIDKAGRGELSDGFLAAIHACD